MRKFLRYLSLMGIFLVAEIFYGSEAANVKVVGHGAAKCERFISDLNIDSNNFRPYLAWAQGYMSGILYYAPSGQDETIDLTPPNMTVMSELIYLRDFCTRSPSYDFSEAVFNLYLHLRGNSQPIK